MAKWRVMTIDWASDGSGATLRRIDSPVQRGEVVKSESPHEAVTLDYDKDGNLISVEVLAMPIYEDAE